MNIALSLNLKIADTDKDNIACEAIFDPLLSKDLVRETYYIAQ